MAHRRISSAEKGKGVDLENQQPPRTARVKVPLPDNSDLLRKHTLTLIGRVTNKSTQKVWSLIPFFTDHWKTEFKPIGSDLGNGLFQFQFETEADLLSVLDQRPYHYARWMVIVQRWEPTVSPSFPSLIPFWVKVQGLPVHLWTEPTVECIGRDIGLYEKSEITPLSVRMRVHIDGLLPLIKKSVVEYPNGDEVSITLVYERLDKHCLKCCRLDHELKECLVARAEQKGLRESQGAETSERPLTTSGRVDGPARGLSAASTRPERSHPGKPQGNTAVFQFSASNGGVDQTRRRDKEARDNSSYRAYKSQSNLWVEKGSYRRTSQARERSDHNDGRSSRPPRDHHYQRNPPAPRKSYYREVSQRTPEPKETGSSASKSDHGKSNRGIPLENVQAPFSREAIDKAMGEVRDTMLQYTMSADPQEREARKERLRQAEAQGDIENTALLMLAEPPTVNVLNHRDLNPTDPHERLPASQRLGPSPTQSHPREHLEEGPLRSPQERLPATLRLGPPAPLQGCELKTSSADRTVTMPETGPDRVPALKRLSITTERLEGQEAGESSKITKRKPGRPPGSRNGQEKPKQTKGSGQRNRRVATAKPSPVRRKTTEDKRGEKPTAAGTSTSRARNKTASSTTSSENRPICNMVPPVVRKRMDFRTPSTPGP